MSQVWEQRREQADESLALTELPSSWGDRQVCAETSTRVCASWTEQRDRGKRVGFSCLSSGRGLLCAGDTRLLGWHCQSLLRWPSPRSPRKALLFPPLQRSVCGRQMGALAPRSQGGSQLEQCVCPQPAGPSPGTSQSPRLLHMTHTAALDFPDCGAPSLTPALNPLSKKPE